jgi:large subunit ribosomal protein L20
MRVTNSVASRKRRKKILKATKGFHGARSLRIKAAKEALLHSMSYQYRDRRLRKRTFRALWITRLSAAVKPFGITYSRFIEGLNKAKVSIDRKMLSNLFIEEPELIKKYVDIAKEHIGK